MSTYTHGGIIAAVEPESFASEIGLQVGDEILAVNGHPVEDVIDVQFYAAEEWIELKIQRGGMLLTCKGGREYNQTLGIEFEHPTFDIDIRRCNNLCPFNAIVFHADREVSEVNPALCQGCGTCVAACPAGAISGTGFSDQQVLAQLDGLLLHNVQRLEAVAD